MTESLISSHVAPMARSGSMPVTAKAPISQHAKSAAAGKSLTTLSVSADSNSDGVPDLVTRHPDGGLSSSTGDGTGGYKTGQKIGTGWQIYDHFINTGDFDSDGKPDLLARHPNGSLLVLLRRRKRNVPNSAPDRYRLDHLRPNHQRRRQQQRREIGHRRPPIRRHPLVLRRRRHAHRRLQPA